LQNAIDRAIDNAIASVCDRYPVEPDIMKAFADRLENADNDG
jgi:hypothetical protein